MNPIKRWLWFPFLLAFLAALALHSQRWSQESQHTRVELVTDYNSLVELGRSQGKDWTEVLPEFTRYGVNSLAFSELRLEELESYGICTVYSGVSLGAETHIGSGPAPLPVPQHTYLIHWGDQENPYLSFADLKRNCSDTFGEDRVHPWSLPGSPAVKGLEIDLPLRAVQSVGVCFPEWAIRTGLEQKLGIWLRPENKPPLHGDAQATNDRYLERMKAFPISGVIFGGAANEALGYPQEDLLKRTATTIAANHWKLGLIELPKATQQKGIETMVRAIPTDTVRVFAVPPAQQAPLKPERVAQMYCLAARERNLTLLYMRPYAYDPSPDKGFENANSDFFGAVHQELSELGRLGPADVFASEVKVSGLLAALLSLAGLSAFWMVVAEFANPPAVVVGGSLLGFAALNFGVVSLGGGVAHLWLALMALGSACCISGMAVVKQFPLLRAAAQEERFGALMGISTRAWLGMSCLSLCGAWIASAFLQETSYKLGLDIFRGVKLLTVAMPLLITLTWAISPQERQHWLQLSSAPMRLYQLVGLAILGIGGVFYTMRTGNMAGDVGGDALEMEKYVRMYLDRWLGVRPRFKEFLMAHPAMLMVPVAHRLGWRELTAVMLLVGCLGQCGLLDTFAHVHTPLKVSLIRCVLGAALGGVLGWVFAGILWRGAKALKWL